jgi:glycosyltransferase 2 family protein
MSPSVGAAVATQPGLESWLRADLRHFGRGYVSATLVAGAAISGGALVAVTWMAGWDRVWRGLLGADWIWLVVAPIGVLLSHLGYALTYREVARVGEGPDLAGEEAVAMVTTGFGPFSPRGGFALDARGFRNLGLNKREASLRVRTLGMIEYAVLAPAAFACALYMLITGSSAQAGVLPSWVIGVPLGTGVAIGLLLTYRKAGRPRSWWAPVKNGLSAIASTLAVLRSWATGPLSLLGMSVYWAADIAVLAACIAVFTHRHSIGPAIVVGYATGYALTRRTLPLAGAGAVEALLPFALTWVGYPLATAILAVITYRLFNLWFAVIPAVAGLHRLRQQHRTGRREAALDRE